MKRESVDVAVIGAGIIGLATACRLAEAGREVLVIDPNDAGSGASHGNAGTLAPYACVPIGNPDVLRGLPSLLLSGDSPFAIRWSAAPALAPWLARFAQQCLGGYARANALALAALLRETVPAWRELADAAGASAMLRGGGCLYAYRKRGGADETTWAFATRAEFGVAQQRLGPDEVAALEPNLPRMDGGGIFFPDAVRIADPAKLTQALAAAAAASGKVVMRRAAVARLEPQSDGSVWLDGVGLSLTARQAVVAAGAHSRPLARQAGDRIPLETERGYHVEFAMSEPLLERPVCPIEYGFYLTPMEGRLRAAGTVELGGLEAPATEARLKFIEAKTRALFPQLGPASAQWLGFRPSLPDSRPIIGYARSTRAIVYAFGHGHLGMTFAAVTARRVADLVAGRADMEALAPFAASRFQGWA